MVYQDLKRCHLRRYPIVMSLIDLNQLYRLVFPFVGPPFPGDRITRASALNENFRMPLSLRIPAEGEQFYRLPNEPIISVSGGKDTVKTTVNLSREGNVQRRGTIKEIMALNDWRILIRGIVVNEDREAYPEFDIREIIRMANHPGAVEVENYLLNQVFDVNLVNIEKPIHFRRNSDLPFHVQGYELNCDSDEDFDLEVGS